MPFSYGIPLPIHGHSESTGPAVLTKLLVKPGTWVERGDPIAIVQVGGSQYEVQVAGPGVLHQFLCRPPAILSAGQEIAVMHADGEDIPYNRPLSMAKQL